MDLPVNQFKRAIQERRMIYGTWLVSGAAATAEALGSAGYDVRAVGDAVAMRGAMAASHAKNRGMASSRRTCPPTAESEKTLWPSPSTHVNTTSTVQSNTPSASPSITVLLVPRTRPSRQPSRCNGPPRIENPAISLC